MKNRTNQSIKNASTGLIAQLLNNILAFLTRTVFIKMLGNSYLGLNGLFSDILSLLSLAEMGFGTAIIYSMYKPVAENNIKKTSALLGLYKKIYIILGSIITFVGLLIIPFLPNLITDLPNISNLNFIYILFLLNTSLSYFWSYKKSILIVEQNAYVLSVTQMILNIIQNIIQILILIFLKNYILYLVTMLASTILTNLTISIYVDRNYKYLKENKNEKLSKGELSEISKNVKGMFVNKISSVIVTSTDNLLISKFVSTTLLGLYSNYVIFVNLLRQITGKAFEAITGSIGNLVATESSDKSYEIYCNISFINFWICGFMCLGLFGIINTFIELWIGKEYVLNNLLAGIICLNLFMRLFRNTSLTYIDTYGLFYEMKWKCIAEALLNIIISLFFLKVLQLGIFGVLLGTFVSNILTNFWFEPYILYKNKFNKNLKKYFIDFMQYIFCLMLSTLICLSIFYFCSINNLFVLIVFKGIVCSLIFNAIFICMFRKRKEFCYMKNLIIRVLNNKKRKNT